MEIPPNKPVNTEAPQQAEVSEGQKNIGDSVRKDKAALKNAGVLLDKFPKIKGIDKKASLGSRLKNMLLSLVRSTRFSACYERLKRNKNEVDFSTINLSLADTEGNTLLHKFCQDGDLDRVKILLEHIEENKDLIRMNNKNQTIFMSAIKGGNIEVAEELLKRFNIDMNHVDSNGDTALTLACEQHETSQAPLDMIAFVMQKSGKDLKPNHVGSNGQTALSKLVSKGRIDGVSVFMDELKNLDPLLDPGDKFDINKSGKNGATALHIAAAQDFLGCMEKILGYPEIEPNKPDNSGITALHLSVMAASPPCVKALLQHPGIEPNKPDNSGVTPLQMATKWASSGDSCYRVADILSQNKYIDVSIQDKSKHDALGYAIDHGAVDLVESFFEEKCFPGKSAQVENVHINKLRRIYNSRHNALKHLTGKSIVQDPAGFAALEDEEKNFSEILEQLQGNSRNKHEAAKRLQPCRKLRDLNYTILDRLRCDAFKYAIDRENPEMVERLLSHLPMSEGIAEKLDKELVKLGSAVGKLLPNPHSGKKKSNKFDQLVNSVKKYDSMLRAFNQYIPESSLEDSEANTLQSCNDKLHDLQVKIREKQQPSHRTEDDEERFDEVKLDRNGPLTHEDIDYGEHILAPDDTLSFDEQNEKTNSPKTERKTDSGQPSGGPKDE